ncbi:MAG TPA: trypsin-like peptidase domain-containing protein [Vicinamibacterales bacterium]
MSNREQRCLCVGPPIVAVLLALAAAAPGASAQQRPCSDTTAAIYDRVSPGVVFIEGTSINPYRVTDRVQHIVGSGFIINADGAVLTNSHVALGRQALSVTLNDGTTVPARLVAADAIFDIAILQIPKPSKGTLPTLALGDSDSLRVGEDVLAIGNPLGLSQTLTHGIVSAVNRVLPVTFFSQMEPMIQIDAPINHGNSGGPLINRCGDVIGMTTAVVAGSQGIGLAIPVNLIKQVLPAFAKDRRLIRPWLGFHGQFVDDDLRGLLNIPLKTGFMIEVVEPGSPAEDAPLQGGNMEMTIAGHDFLFGGDIVVRMNDKALDTPDDVIAVLATLKVGSAVTMTVFRDGKSVDVKYVLPERPLLPGDIAATEGEAWPMSAKKPPAVRNLRF